MPAVIISIILCLVANLAGAEPPQPVEYEWLTVDGIGVHVVKINLNDKNVCVTPAIAARGRGSSESLGSFVARTHPTAAVTGTFFDMRTLVPVGDIAIAGKVINRGHLSRGIRAARGNDVSFGRRGCDCKEPWPGAGFVLCSGPRLITNGKIAISPKSEGFRDRRLCRRSRRTAVGLTDKNKLVFVAVNTPIYLSTLARVMKKIGCTDAMNLDGGASSALYYRGKTLAKPGRCLTNVLLVYENRSLFEQHTAYLAPTWFKAWGPRIDPPVRLSGDSPGSVVGCRRPLCPQYSPLFSPPDRRLFPPWRYVPDDLSGGGAERFAEVH